MLKEGYQITDYDRTVPGFIQLILYSLSVEHYTYGDPELERIQDFTKAIAYFYPGDKEKLRTASPLKILVICDQNQGRSQMVAAVIAELARNLGLNAEVKSAGQHATPEKYDGKPPGAVCTGLERRQLDMSGATVNQLVPADSDENTIVLLLNDPATVSDFVYNARLVVNRYMMDQFPGSKVPKDADQILEEVIDESAFLGIQFVLELARAIEFDDFERFVQIFKRVN